MVGHAEDIVGGLVGVSSASIINSHATGDVTGGSQVGGLVGNMSGWTYEGLTTVVTNSYATGNVKTTAGPKGNEYSINMGGLIGSLNGYGDTVEVTNSHATGNVSLDQDRQIWFGNYVGGLIGTSRDAKITDSSATGKIDVYGTATIGGLIGFSNSNEIHNSHAKTNITATRPNNLISIEPTYREVSIGGFVGAGSGSITNSSAHGTIAADGFNDVGGFAGKFIIPYNNSASKIANSQSHVIVKAVNDTASGTFIGQNYSNELNNIAAFGTLNGEREPLIGEDHSE